MKNVTAFILCFIISFFYYSCSCDDKGKRVLKDNRAVRIPDSADIELKADSTITLEANEAGNKNKQTDYGFTQPKKVEVEQELTKPTNTAKKSLSLFALDGEIPDTDYEFTLVSDAVEDVVLNRKEVCEANCGKQVILENYNEDMVVEVAVKVRWKEKREKMETVRVYLVKPGEKKKLGCTQVCSDDQSLYPKWSIVSAKYPS